MMNIEQLIHGWIAASNAFNTLGYLAFYLDDAILDDPSVGRVFKGHEEIREYFESYFIGYHTQTTKKKLMILSPVSAHLEVDFKGSFPQGEIGGTFDFTFNNGKIAFVRADLID